VNDEMMMNEVSFAEQIDDVKRQLINVALYRDEKDKIVDLRHVNESCSVYEKMQ
jgi:hypothetical protein